MKTKKILFAITIILVVMLLIMLINKLFVLNKFKSEEIKLNVNNIFDDKLTVVNYKEIEHDEVLNYEGLTIKNYFKEYKTNENNSNFHVKYDSDGNIESFYAINKSQQYVNVLNIDSFSLYTEDDYNKYNFVTDKSMKSYLKDKKIDNDIDLLNYIKNNYYIKNNIFMDTKTIKNNFLINSFVEATLPEFNNIVIINGRISGYILNIQAASIKEIHILNNDMQYIITLSGESLTNDGFIIKLLETIKF